MKQHLIVLTGASRGMGLGMAKQLVQPGNTLLCISRNTNAELQKLAEKTADFTLEQWALDLADGAAASTRLKAWLDDMRADLFGSATLINNAALLPRIASLSEVGADEIASVLRVGLEAPMQLTAAFIKGTKRWVGPRKVLNISSGNGRRAMASQATYSAAKAGMDHYSRVVAVEEAALPNGAKICSLAPGVIDTDMQTHLRAADPSSFPDKNVFINYKDAGQLLTPDAAATRVLKFLARDDFGSNPVADVRDA